MALYITPAVIYFDVQRYSPCFSNLRTVRSKAVTSRIVLFQPPCRNIELLTILFGSNPAHTAPQLTKRWFSAGDTVILLVAVGLALSGIGIDIENILAMSMKG